MTESGDLIVLDVDRQAAGNYTCQAANMAGFRQTPTANVWVYGNIKNNVLEFEPIINIKKINK